MKKYTSIVLICCIIAGIFTGCNKSNWQKYKDEVSKFSSADKTFSLEIFTNSEDSFIKSFLGIDQAQVNIDGQVSKTNNQAHMDISVEAPALQGNQELTDLYIDESNIFINLDKLLSKLSLGADGIISSIFGDFTNGYSYAMLELSGEGKFDIWSNVLTNSNLLSMVKNISGIIDDIVQNHKCVVKDGDKYILELNGAALQELILSILDNLIANEEDYYDAIVQLCSDDMLSAIGQTGEELTQSREEKINDLDSKLNEMKNIVESSDFSDAGLTSTTNGNFLTFNISFSLKDGTSYSISYSGEKAEVDTMEIPEEYILWDDFIDNLGIIGQILPFAG